jgi:hypothetical protein
MSKLMRMMIMLELLYAMTGGVIIYVCIKKVDKAFYSNIKNKNYIIEDDRDTDERRIAGEDTSEIALNYLKKL